MLAFLIAERMKIIFINIRVEYNKMTKILQTITPIILAVLMFSLYYPTLARSVYTEDSAEFVAASHTLSVAHPSGYPTYLMTSKLFSVLPIFSSVVERINFASLFWTIAAVILLYYSLLKIFKSKLIGFSLSFLFAIAPMVWLQATYAEVYALNTFFFILLFWLYLYYNKNPSRKRMYLFIFGYGLSLTNHYLPLALSPLILGWVLYSFPLHNNFKLYPKLFGFWLIGLLPYLYIPIRARMEPAFNWFDGSAFNLLTFNIAYGHKISMHTVRYFADVWDQFLSSFGFLYIIVFMFGIALMLYYKHQLRTMVLASLALLSFGLVITLTNGNEYTEFAGWFYKNLYIPFLLVSLVPAGFALLWLSRSKYKLIFFYTALLAILIWPTMELGNRFLNNDRSEYVFLNNYSSYLLNSLPQDATLFTYHDNVVNDPLVFGLTYQRFVKNLRQDVTIYSLTSVLPPPDNFPVEEAVQHKDDYQKFYKQYIEQNFSNEKNIYSTFAWPNSDTFTSTSIGPAYALTPKGKERPLVQQTQYYAADNLYLPSVNNNFFNQATITKYYYDLAANMYATGNLKSGQWFLAQALEHDLQEYSTFYKNTVLLRKQFYGN